MENHYRTLGLHPNAAPQEIKKAYFELAKKYHPDSGVEAEIKKFYQITEAYNILADKDLKKAYDATLSEGLEKINTAQEEIVKENPKEPNHYAQNRDPYRDDELKEFHRNRYLKAVYRVVGFTMISSILGATLAAILGGTWYFGFLAGFSIGFSISIRENFDVTTFFEAAKKQKLFLLFLWLILILSGLYFASLLLFSIL